MMVGEGETSKLAGREAKCQYLVNKTAEAVSTQYTQ